MSVNTNKLTVMINAVPAAISNGEANISSATDQITEVTSQKNAIQDGVCGTAKTNAIAFITNIILPLYPLAEEIGYGPGFGTIAWSDPGPVGNIAAWYLYWDVLDVPTPLYVYTPGAFPVLDVLVADYSYGNDYLTRPLTSGATYGLTPTISLLNSGKSILQNNVNKLGSAIDVFSRYST